MSPRPSFVLKCKPVSNSRFMRTELNFHPENNRIEINDFIVDSKWGEDDPSVSDDEVNTALNSMSGDVDFDINSRGGEIGPGLSIYNAMRRYSDEGRGKVTTNVVGYAFSTAGWLSLAGDERNIALNGLFMCHNPMVFPMINSLEAIDSVRTEWSAYKTSITNIFTDRTSLSSEDVSDMMDKETFLTADEAVEKGIYTNVTGRSADLKALNYCPVESLPERMKKLLPAVDIKELKDRRVKALNARAKHLREV